MSIESLLQSLAEADMLQAGCPSLTLGILKDGTAGSDFGELSRDESGRYEPTLSWLVLGKERSSMTGRERIEAAFSDAGARELPAVVCYESVFLRDHWAEFTRLP